MDQAIASARAAGADIIVEPFKDPIGVDAFVNFSRGKVVADNWHADAAEIGRPGQTFRRVRVESKFGKMQVMSTDGQTPYPFGYDISGYEVRDLSDTLAKAKSQDVKILFGPVDTDDRHSALVQFPGGFIAEIHAPLR
jgi:hypothetical protein